MKKITYPLSYAGKRANYAKAVVVGDLVFCSGMSAKLFETGQFREGVAAQTVDALDKVKQNLEDVGTSLENIVHITFYFKDILKDIQTVFDTYDDYLKEHAPSLVENMPAAMSLGVTSLFDPSALIEVVVIAALPD